MVFERYNKKIKNLVGNKNYPIASLATALVRDIAARHAKWMVDTNPPCHSPHLGSRITSEGRMWVPSIKLSTRQVFSLCSCCSNLQLRRSCTQHRVAEVNGVKVGNKQHDTTPLTIYSHIQPITHDSLATTLTHTPLNRHPHTPHTTPSSLQGSL